MIEAHSLPRAGLCIAAAALLVAASATAASPPAVAATTAESAAWPQWRGPNRDAVSVEGGLLRTLADGSPAVLWRIPVGEGYSGISVWQGGLFTLFDIGEDQFLARVDADTSEESWRYRIGPSFASSWGNGPRSTPAVDGGVVYAASARGDLHAVTAADGRKLWSHDLRAEYGGTIPEYGYSSSPLIEGDRLFVEAGGPDDRAFIAFDKATGEVAWTSQSDPAAYSSPLAITVDGVRQVVFYSATGLFALAPGDGRPLWKHPWESRCPATGIPTNVASPVFIPPDRIFVSNGYGTQTGSAVFRILRQGDEFTTETVWRAQTMRNVLNSSVLHDGHIYGFDKAILKAIDAATGEERWQARGFERGSLIVADGRLIVLGERGKLGLVEATPSAYRPKGAAQVLGDQAWTMPSLAGGRLFLRNHSEMVSLDFRRKPR